MTHDSFWSPSICYDQFAVDSYVYVSNNLLQLRTEYKFPQQFFDDVIAVTRNNKDPLMFIHIALFAVVWTMLRYAFTSYLVKPIGKRYKLPESEQLKLPESTWTFVCFTTSSLVTAYILIVKEKGVPLLRPESMWNDWQFTKELPFEYHVLFVFSLSYYLHSVYALVAMDRWRKDSIVVGFHHIIAISLIFFGFSTRIYKTCAVVIFLHDICDVFLEATKTALYFKTQGKKTYPIFELIANVGFLLFCLIWFCSRLYVFPLRLIGTYATAMAKMNVPLSFMMFLGSYLLLAMNVYWFIFILKVIYRVAIGYGVKDLREYEKKTESNDSKGTIKNLPIDSSNDPINKNDATESTRAGHHTNPRKRNHKIS